MKIEFWLDYLCPKCYLQHQIIEELIKNYDMKDIDLVCRSYEMVEAECFDTAVFIAQCRWEMSIQPSWGLVSQQ
jgi:predicted DsbA family dithiol-disulfide isomerase